MKLRVSFCNKTVLRTDLTRFAPLWGGYTLFLALITLMCHRVLGENPDEALGTMARLFSARAGQMVLVNGFYALAVVLLLWGDLLNPRMCNNLHSLPVTRDSYFGAHLVTALLVSFVPNVLVYSVAAVVVPGKIMMAPLMALAAGCLQYIFFLGAALVAVQLAGNRLGLVLSYGMLNFFAILVYWFCAEVFTPLTYGTEANVNWMANICPTVVMYRGSYFVNLEHYIESPNYVYYFDGIQAGGLWKPAVLCALVGVALIGLAQFLYRRRKLETAGDLLAYPGLSPVFLVMNTLMVAAFVHLGVQMMGYQVVSQYFFLPLGLILGYVSGLMLLRRTTRVFRKRLLIPLAGILVICAVTVCGIYTDAFRVIRRVPREDQVVSVVLEPQSAYNRKEMEPITDRQAILTVLRYHQESLEGWQNQVEQSLLQREGCWKPDEYHNVRLVYNLENGRTMVRRYALRKDLASSEAFLKIISCPELVLGCTEAELREGVEKAAYVIYNRYTETNKNVEYRDITFTDRTGLADAIMKDFREGNVEKYSFWDERYGTTQRKENLGELSIQGGKIDDYFYYWFPVTEKTVNTLQWMATHEGVEGNVLG